MRYKATALSLLLAGSPWACPLFAQVSMQPTRVLAEGDLIPNFGQLGTIIQTVLNDQGSFLIEAQPQGSTVRSILRDGFLTFTQGLPIPEPSGWNVGTNSPFQSLAINGTTNIGWILRVEDLIAGTKTEGLYVNVELLHLGGDPLDTGVIDADGLVIEDYTYQFFDYCYLNDANQYIYRGQIGLPGGQRADLLDVTILIDTDGAGEILREKILVREGGTVDGQVVSALPNRLTTLSMNNRGDWITPLRLMDLPSDSDTRVIVNGEVVMREGEVFAPLAKTFDSLLDARTSINDFGDWAVLVPVTTNNLDTLILNGTEIISQKDAPMNSITPNTVMDYGPSNGPRIKLTNSGDVFWYAGISTPPTSKNAAFFRNEEVIVRRGDILPEGTGVISIPRLPNVFDASPNGRWWIGQVGLAGLSIDILIMVDYGLAVPIPGMSINEGTLKKVRGDAQVGQVVTFELGNAQGDGVLPFLFFTLSPAVPGSPYGIMTKFGELFIDPNPASTIGSFGAPPIAGGPANITLTIPPDISLFEFAAWGQGLFLNLNNVAPGEKIRLTNGFAMVIGAP